MTASIYKEAQLVQITPAGEWYVAIPHPEKPGVLAVDVGKNLTFAAEHTPDTLAAVKPVLALNRFIKLRLEFIPGMAAYMPSEASAFNLLANALYQAIADVRQREPEPRNKLVLLTLLELQATLGLALHQALTRLGELAQEQEHQIELLAIGGPVIFSAPGIVVRRPELAQLLAMKLSAWRDDVDIEDARRLLQELIGTQDEIWRAVEPYLVPGQQLKAKYAFLDLWETTYGTD